MRERVRVFLILGGFWLVFMIVARAVFMVYNNDYTSILSITEIGLSMLHGLRMDASITGYLLALSGLVLTASVFIPGRWVAQVITTITLTSLFICCVVVVVDCELYRHWGFRMNTTPLFYIGSEAIGSIEPMTSLKLSILLIVLFVPFWFLYVILVRGKLLALPAAPRSTSLIMFSFSALMFIPIRGSFTVAPMNTGFVYYHNAKPFANHSAINVIWNFFYSVRKGSSGRYPENFFDKTTTETLFDSLHNETATYPVLKTKQPNIILIILESFTADVVRPLGGMPDITPNLNQLFTEGIAFMDCYSSGDRTDKGLISILSGYPAQPQTSIIKFPSKTQRLPQLNQHLKRLGYNTSFIYGGDINFANFRSYLNTSGFGHLTTIEDFENVFEESKWGIHDHLMFDRALEELDTTREKFFKVILTLSSHEPFDVPMIPVMSGDDEEMLFLNACIYADKSLGEFIRKCKEKSWWANTVVVITADHGHRHPYNKELTAKERFRIPLLMIGGAIKQDTVIETYANQTDIANTLLGQLDKPSGEFLFSKNLFAKDVQSFSAYFFNDGYGFLMPGKYIVHDNTGRQFLLQENAKQYDLDLSKAYQQKLYSDYNGR